MGGSRRRKHEETESTGAAGAKKMEVEEPSQKATDGEPVKPEDATAKDYYFDSYAHFGIHEEMLKDQQRTKGYRNAIMNNPHCFRDKIVMDVGCGTGILSMFAVKAGAKHVYGIECSGIIHTARQIIADNGLSDKITLIHGKCEEIDLPVDTVDIIISEWMGYALLYESMLDTVLYARDKWLVKVGGIIMPDVATLYMVGIEDAQYKDEKIHFWDDVYGFDMSCIKKIAIAEPLVDTVNPEQICTKPTTVMTVNIMTVKKEDLTFEAKWELIATRNDYLTALVLYFDVGFTQIHKPLWISTGPRAPYTHWRQTVMYLHDQLSVSKDEAVTGNMTCKPNPSNHRDLDFEISYTHDGKASGKVEASHSYRMR
ncbi:protein arginine N-methyltransferase [Baffinella frigidus]|nr:protein arginine N-methyltransferase [Cryptophyta sp. CCMP2293]